MKRIFSCRVNTIESFMKSVSGQVTSENIKNYVSDKKGVERHEFEQLYRSVLLWNEVRGHVQNMSRLRGTQKSDAGRDTALF